jgi:FkbM family methyltransferase
MFYALRENYEKELLHLDRFVSPGMVVIDGGANCGIYTILAAKLVGPSGLVFSFEPGREAFSILEKNVRLNRLENVRTFHAALSDKKGTATLYHLGDAPNSYSLGAPDTTDVAFEEVTTRSLGQVVPEDIAQRTGLIKLDVEGAEELVLRGAQSILARSHPTIIFEANGPSAKRLGLSPTGSWKLLHRLGYRFFSLTDQGDLCELAHSPAPNDINNIVAIHSRRLT